MRNFLGTSLKNIHKTGTVHPSSRFLIRKMLQDIDFRKPLFMVEFGPGQGCITEEILKRMQPGSRLICFELNRAFQKHLQKKFKADARIKIIHGNALDFGLVINSEPVDAFISGLPISLMKQSDLDKLLHAVSASLTPDGKFVQFQYSPHRLSSVRKYFSKVRVRFTFRNVPPAFIYSCIK